MVSRVLGDDFDVVVNGKVTGLTGLTGGNVYFLNASVAGALTSVPPSSIGDVHKPLLVADSTNSGYFFNWRGDLISPGPTGAAGGYYLFTYTFGR